MKRAAVLLLLVAACGGSSGGTSVSPKAAYVAKAEAVCLKANADIANAKKERPNDIAAVPAYVHRLLDLAKETAQQLSVLTPPSADAAEVKAKLQDPLAQQLADGEAFAAKVDAAKNDPQALTGLVFNPPTATRVDIAWMKAYGFKECVKAADTGGTASK